MKKKFILTFLLLIILTSIIINPKEYILEGLNGVRIWATLLVPSLFPFFFFTKLFTSLNLTDGIAKIFNKFTEIAFNCPGQTGYVFFMSIFSGYPVGAKLTQDLYKQNYINSDCANKMISFTSNSGPMFILGTVGIGMLFSKTAGLIILISHIIGAILNGILYRGKRIKVYNNKNIIVKKLETNNILNDCMINSITSILLVGGYIVICFVLTKVLINLKIISTFSNIITKFIHIDNNILNSLLSGILEITRGCLDLSSLDISLKLKTILCSFIISFGGISTCMQSMAFLKDCNITYKSFLIKKITHAIFSTVICVILVNIFI